MGVLKWFEVVSNCFRLFLSGFTLFKMLIFVFILKCFKAALSFICFYVVLICFVIFLSVVLLFSGVSKCFYMF